MDQTLIIQLLKECSEFIGEYREKVMKGRLKGDLIKHDYALYRDVLEVIKVLKTEEEKENNNV